MDILIKNMEMPKSCIDADTSHGCFCLLHCKVGREMVKKGKSLDGRPKDCPLVALPEHGDLVIRDSIATALRDYLLAHFGERLDEDLSNAIYSFIAEAETIVEATE